MDRELAAALRAAAASGSKSLRISVYAWWRARAGKCIYARMEARRTGLHALGGDRAPKFVVGAEMERRILLPYDRLSPCQLSPFLTSLHKPYAPNGAALFSIRVEAFRLSSNLDLELCRGLMASLRMSTMVVLCSTAVLARRGQRWGTEAQGSAGMFAENGSSCPQPSSHTVPHSPE